MWFSRSAMCMAVVLSVSLGGSAVATDPQNDAGYGADAPDDASYDVPVLYQDIWYDAMFLPRETLDTLQTDPQAADPFVFDSDWYPLDSTGLPYGSMDARFAFFGTGPAEICLVSHFASGSWSDSCAYAPGNYVSGASTPQMAFPYWRDHYPGEHYFLRITGDGGPYKFAFSWDPDLDGPL